MCTAHVAVLPSPGMGHLIPLAEFAKRLVNLHGIAVTFIFAADAPPSKAQKSTLDSLPAAVTSVFLPPADLSDLPEHTSIETRISLTVARSLPFLRDSLREILATTKLAAFIVDLFGTDAFDVAWEFDIPPYIFYPSTAMVLSFFLQLPKIDQTVSGEFRDLPEPIQIPGCVPVPGKDLLDPVQNRAGEAYSTVLRHCKRYQLAEGILSNSFVELEAGAIKALQISEQGKPPVYPIGPLVNRGSDGKTDGSGCLEWLDDQPEGSVLYVSFGSGGTLSWAQLKELALGLEMSEQRFLLVLRSPNDGIANASFFNEQSQKDPLAFLPDGFLERTKRRGMVVPSWAPQAQVLRHGGTGGFLTHCGWNSVLESVVNGVPLIAWPLYAEQRMNAVMLTEGVKVAIRPAADEKGMFLKEEIARVVKGLMEGEEGKGVRNRMRELKEAADRALISDGGSSAALLAGLARKWKNDQTPSQRSG